MKNRLRKAVIPAAGLGTRFLPATKTVPKEMLAVVDKPILLYVVEEAVRAGIEDIVLIQGRGKNAIEDFFDCSFELESILEKTGKSELLESILRVKNLANIISVRQKVAGGLGHAVYSARPVVGEEPFAVLLGDEIMVDEPGQASAIGQLSHLYQEYQKSVVGVMEVRAEDVRKYGIIGGPEISPGLIRAEKVIEKPEPKDAPSRWAIPGRYVFDAAIFTHLQNTKPGKNGEIQLTDGMEMLAKAEGLLASRIRAQRFDAGDRLGYLQANVEIALSRADLRDQFLPYLKALLARIDGGGR